MDFKNVYVSLIIGPIVLGFETNLQEITGWETSDMVRFDLGPPLQGQMSVAKIKSAKNSLIIRAERGDQNCSRIIVTYFSIFSGNSFYSFSVFQNLGKITDI